MDFQVHYSLEFNGILSSASTYLLEITGNFETLIATGLSDNNIKVFDIEKLCEVGCFGHDRGITGLRFSPKSDQLLYSSSLDGSIKLWDLRKKVVGKCVSEFSGKWTNDDGNAVSHPLSAFDVCNRDRIIVAGTESDGVDSFLLFWDVRAPLKPIGGYWESHSEDITQVKFHPTKSDVLAGGSMDGLINIFDIRQNCEDEALSNSLNTESSVEKIAWLNNYKPSYSSKDSEFISCITHAESLQIWDTEEPSQINNFSRNEISAALKVNSSEDCYIAGVFFNGKSQEETLILGGSTESECLPVLYLEDGQLKRWACLKECHQVVRCCWGNPKSGLLATGGEGGMLDLWRQESKGDSQDQIPSKETYKIKVKKRSTMNANPY